jgi:hypothetical protein
MGVKVRTQHGNQMITRLNSLIVSVAFLATRQPSPAADQERQAEVSARGAQVMPFQLSATTHVFTKTATGGVQQVVAKDLNDTKQIGLIRQHLSDIADRFAGGDFSGPTETHGAQMPGLAQLKGAKPGELRVLYTEIPAGGQIEYFAKSDQMISAIHEWFDAQVSDHGHDAVEGHQHH